MRSTTTRGTAARGRGTRVTGVKSKGEIRATNLQGEDRKYLEAHGGQLSPSTMRAKWINDPGEHQDRPGQTLATRSPDVIKHWAEDRGAVPSTVPGTEHDGHLGVLRFNFPGYGGASLEEVSWEDWLGTFKSRDLVFVFQENKKDGAQSNFFKLDNPNREDG